LSKSFEVRSRTDEESTPGGLDELEPNVLLGATVGEMLELGEKTKELSVRDSSDIIMTKRKLYEKEGNLVEVRGRTFL
jgi:hypothetical protein